MSKRILVTGAAGFIGFHLILRLIKNANFELVVGLDNLNEYYDKKLKIDRLNELGIIDENSLCEVKSQKFEKFKFHKLDLIDLDSLDKIMRKYHFDYVVNLAAQAGVRYSLISPNSYISSNISGFMNILEVCRNFKIEHLLFASSSSVYGLNNSVPFKEDYNTDTPISLYAATKKSDELMAYSYAHLFKIPSTGMRFFTVYGPWGRPDMALFMFTKAILNREPISLYNFGKMYRDFTYVDDLVIAIEKLVFKPPTVSKNVETISDILSVPYNVFNIGNGNSVELIKYIEILERALEIESIKDFKELQQGDVIRTYADCSKLYNYINYKPQTDLDIGVKKFVNWYRNYYNV